MYLIGLAHEMKIGPAANQAKKSDSLSKIKNLLERNGAPEMLRDSRAFLTAGILYDWSRGIDTEAIMRKFSLSQDNYGFIERDIPQNAIWILGFLVHCVRENLIPVSTAIGLGMKRMLDYLQAGTNSDLIRGILALGVPAVGRPSALAIVDNFALHELGDMQKIGVSIFGRFFKEKEALARGVYRSILEKLA